MKNISEFGTKKNNKDDNVGRFKSDSLVNNRAELLNSDCLAILQKMDDRINELRRSSKG